jgi:hypothetical protein
LVADIQAMGLSAVQAGPGSLPQTGDIVIRGYLVSVQGGGAVKRFVIGFGYGTSEMDTVTAGYLITNQGLQLLGSGTLSSSGSKNPWSYRSGSCDDRYRQSYTPDCCRRGKNSRGGEWQKFTSGESQVDGRRDCGAAQDQISVSRLDKLRIGLRAERPKVHIGET